MLVGRSRHRQVAHHAHLARAPGRRIGGDRAAAVLAVLQQQRALSGGAATSSASAGMTPDGFADEVRTEKLARLDRLRTRIPGRLVRLPAAPDGPARRRPRAAAHGDAPKHEQRAAAAGADRPAARPVAAPPGAAADRGRALDRSDHRGAGGAGDRAARDARVLVLDHLPARVRAVLGQPGAPDAPDAEPARRNASARRSSTR